MAYKVPNVLNTKTIIAEKKKKNAANLIQKFRFKKLLFICNLSFPVCCNVQLIALSPNNADKPRFGRVNFYFLS